MKKKKEYSCDIVFKDFEGEVRGLFSTEHILNCFNNREVYVSILQNENIKTLFKDEELMSTVNHFFKNNLNVLQTSKSSFMHRNTLLYRLDKIKKLTGLNLKSFEDAVVFENLICVKNLLS